MFRLIFVHGTNGIKMVDLFFLWLLEMALSQLVAAAFSFNYRTKFANYCLQLVHNNV